MGKRPRKIVSYNMSQIRSKNTQLEAHLEEVLKKTGLKYEKNYDTVGKPDFAFPELKIAIFADSKFWHGYNWSEEKEKIKTNRDFWIPKIERNIKRDQEVNQALDGLGWNIIRFWEHEIIKEPDNCLGIIKQAIDKKKGAQAR
jgi:DNA mismatch endonuclease Vsr